MKKQQEAGGNHAQQRELAFGVFLPHCLRLHPDPKDATVAALDMARVSLQAAEEYFKPKLEPKPKSAKPRPSDP